MQYPQPNPPFPPQQMQVREKRQYGAIAALVLSLFSGSLYRDVARRWRGIGFWYLVFLLLVTWVPVAIFAHIGFSKFVRDDARTELAGCPTITIQDGKASIAEPEPYLWKDVQSGKVLLYVDTTGAFDKPEGKDAFAKLSQSKLEYKKSQSQFDTQTQTIDLSQIKQFSVDKNRVQGWLETFSHFTGVAIVGWGLTGALLYHLLQIVIFAAIGTAIASGMNAKLSYGAIMRLAAVAITPAMILSVVVGFLNLESCSVYFLYLIIEIIALVLAIRANAGTPGLPPTGFPAAYPPGYGAAPGGYPQPPAGYGMPPQPQQPSPGYGIPPQQFPPGPPR